MKKYLKTIEGIEALRYTDTKIYFEKGGGYVQFVNGWPCHFFSNGDMAFCSGILLSGKPYIKVPNKPDEYWVGKLGWVSDKDDKDKTRLEILRRCHRGGEFPYETDSIAYWKYFTPLTPEEVKKYTGYKVVEED